jgi:hypothetical protein
MLWTRCSWQGRKMEEKIIWKKRNDNGISDGYILFVKGEEEKKNNIHGLRYTRFDGDGRGGFDGDDVSLSATSAPGLHHWNGRITMTIYSHDSPQPQRTETWEKA